MLVMVTAEAPVLVKVTACGGLVLPTLWSLKVKLAGATVTVEAALVPFKTIVWGLVGAVSVMVIAPVRAPVAVGVNVMLMAQLVCTAKVVPQVLDWAKSPLATILEMVNGAGPEFHTVTVCAALVVSKGWSAKVRLLGESPMKVEFK